jgi:hypothetical protein
VGDLPQAERVISLLPVEPSDLDVFYVLKKGFVPGRTETAHDGVAEYLYVLNARR